MFEKNDPRNSTYITRIEIGFSENFNNWKDAPAILSKTQLEIEGHSIMEDWERPYMKELAETVAYNGGRILEVGFGLGISAEYIQKHNIKEHVVIEANYQVFQKLLEFKANFGQKISPIFGFWQEIVSKLESKSFDGILFDTYPLNKNEIHANHFPFFIHAYRLLKKGGIFTYYSDEISDYSENHYKKLHSAGFSKIKSKICNVNPPESCLYWTEKSILVPIITK